MMLNDWWSLAEEWLLCQQCQVCALSVAGRKTLGQVGDIELRAPETCLFLFGIVYLTQQYNSTEKLQSISLLLSDDGFALWFFCLELNCFIAKG